MKADYYIELYDTPDTTQRWRWRARSARNGKIMGDSSEAYVNEQDARDAALNLFSGDTTVHMHWDSGELVIRDALPVTAAASICQHCGHNVLHHLTEQGCGLCECVHSWEQTS